MIKYKFDILDALKTAGYNTTKLRRDKLLGEGTLSKLRADGYISLDSINTVCSLLQCQPGDLIAYIPDEQQQDTNP